MMLKPASNRKQHGQWSLVGVLVALAIVIMLASMYAPRIAATHSAPGQPRTPKERAYGAACSEYLGQMNMAVTMYKTDHDDQVPPSVDDLKKYGVGDEILHAPGCTYQIDPTSGQVSETSNGRLAPGPVPGP